MTKLQTPQHAPAAPRVRDVILRDGTTLRLRPPVRSDAGELVRSISSKKLVLLSYSASLPGPASSSVPRRTEPQ